MKQIEEAGQTLDIIADSMHLVTDSSSKLPQRPKGKSSVAEEINRNINRISQEANSSHTLAQEAQAAGKGHADSNPAAKGPGGRVSGSPPQVNPLHPRI